MPEKSAPTVLFRENQRFRQPMLWAVLVPFASITIGSALYVSRHSPTATSSLLLGLFVVLPVALTLSLLATAKLQIEVSTLGLFVKFFPFHRKVRQIELDKVVRVEAVHYKAVREYGGYGIRLLPRAKAYNTGGDEGVRIEYTNGCHVLIGTRHPHELCTAILRILPTLETTEKSR